MTKMTLNLKPKPRVLELQVMVYRDRTGLLRCRVEREGGRVERVSDLDESEGAVEAFIAHTANQLVIDSSDIPGG